MTTHCPGCPFKACPTCQYQGANVVGAQGDNDYAGGSKTAPGVASTNTESLVRSEAAKPHGRTCIT